MQAVRRCPFSRWIAMITAQSSQQKRSKTTATSGGGQDGGQDGSAPSRAIATSARAACAICLYEPSDDDDGGESGGSKPMLVAKCGHVACKECWSKWKKSEQNVSQCRKLMNEPGGVQDCPMVCPMCRSPIHRKTLKPLTVTVLAH